MSLRRFVFTVPVIITVLATFSVFGTVGAQDLSGSYQDIQSFGTVLLGSSVVPDHGDTDGIGIAAISVNPSLGRVCWGVTASNIAPATAAHISRGSAGTAGPVVVSLTPPGADTSVGCAPVDGALIQDILVNPGQYYVSVHNAEYPAGALRGQLD
jgi:hypothetical protein